MSSLTANLDNVNSRIVNEKRYPSKTSKPNN